MNGRRYTNLKHPERYCTAVENGEAVWFEEEFLTPEAERLEKIMLGLRLNEGLFLGSVDVDDLAVGDLQRRGWVEELSGVLKLTDMGKHFCSEVVLALS